MDFELPEELRLLKDNLRKFVDKELIPLEREVVNDIRLQKELPKKLRPKVDELVGRFGRRVWQKPADAALNPLAASKDGTCGTLNALCGS